MRIIDTYPNAERTITTIEAALITKKEYQELKNISQSIRNKFHTQLSEHLGDYEYIRWFLETILTYSQNKFGLSSTHKEIIIANVMLPHDHEIVELLTKYDFKIEHLKTLIRFRSFLKNIVLNSAPIDKEVERQFEIYKKHIANIIYIFETELNINNKTAILNRIAELIETNPHYFESKYSDYTKKR